MKNQNEEIRIAGNKTIIEWTECLKKLDEVSTTQDWEDAFDFFYERIKTRYLNPIKLILDMDLSTGEGFAVVNLQCSLIETIESFYNGWIYEFSPNYKKSNYKNTNDKLVQINNSDIFISFFKKREPFAGQIDGIDFFRNVRCGLLHETQTKNGWVIMSKHSDEKNFFENEGKKKIIYRNNFQKAIEDVIDKYKSAIVNRIDYGEVPVPELRENFKAKFDHICTISENKK